MSILQTVGPEVWSIPSEFKRPGGVRFPLRTTVVRLPSGELLLHSPIAIDQALADHLATLGPVAHLVAPNLLHHLFLPGARSRYPQARLYGPPGLANKRRDLTFDEQLSDGAPAAWGGSVEALVIKGAPMLNEVVLFHRPSATLIVGDLLFNVVHPANFISRILFAMMGTAGRLAKSRAWRLFTKDKGAVAESFDRVLAWPFTRISLAHGDPVTQDAHALASAALRPQRSGSPVSSAQTPAR